MVKIKTWADLKDLIQKTMTVLCSSLFFETLNTPCIFAVTALMKQNGLKNLQSELHLKIGDIQVNSPYFTETNASAFRKSFFFKHN